MIKFFADKWPLILSWSVCSALLCYAYACEPQTKSLLDQNEQSNRESLQLEFETLAKRFELGIADLDRQVEIRNLILNQSLIIAETGSVNPISIITSILAILGVGGIADDLRIRKRLKDVTNSK